MKLQVTRYSVIGLLLSIIACPVYCNAEVYRNASFGLYVPSNSLSNVVGTIMIDGNVGIRQIAGFAAEVGLGIVASDEASSICMQILL